MVDHLYSYTITTRNSEECNNDEVKLREYYYKMLLPLIHKSKKNTEVFEYVFGDEVDNIFLVINSNRFIIKNKGIFYPDVEDFEHYMFINFYKYSMFHMIVDIIPVMVTDDDKKNILKKRKTLRTLKKVIDFDKVMRPYLTIDSYYKININISNPSLDEGIITH